MTNWKMMGVTCGIIIGLIICVFLFRLINRDGKMSTKYDEMQNLIRGRAYKFAFIALLIYEAVMAVLSSDETQLPLTGFAIHFLAIIIGVVVQVSYCIWHDAYIGINTNFGRFAIISVVISVINFAFAFMAIANHSMYQNGQLQEPFMNLICGIIFVIIGIELFIKHILDISAGEE